MKKIISVLLSIILILGICSATVFASEVVANPTNSKITVNGAEVKFDAYNINGNNYFKLRDIAYVLSDTDSCFSVNWVAENNSANLILGEKYVSVAGEMSLGSNEQKSAKLSNTNIMVNGETVTATAYLINNNNYFKLRDLGNLLDFGVDWDEQSQTVIISSKNEEVIEVPKISVNISQFEREKINLNETQSNNIDTVGKNEEVHQFLYKNEGLAYAYIEKGNDDLVIVLPNDKLTIKKEYPILGDVISDEEGYIYVIWGKTSTVVNGKAEQSIYVSKYSSTGDLILTRGVYDSRGENMNYISKEPFVGANTASAIHGDILVISFGKITYDNEQQAGGTVAVKTNDLFPVVKPDWSKIASGHCYGNDIVWRDQINDFFFVSESDYKPRGFHISSAKHTATVIFDFYLQPDANNDMDIISQTFAQMGGLIRTDKSFVFCGASAKSISEDAKKENQNLFIQMFDIDYDHNISYIGGETREGLTAKTFMKKILY
jgi:hypothetical protein